MTKGYMYILLCSDGSYYTGSTKNLELRVKQHNNGEGANHTKKRLPVELVYFEEFDRIDEAFYREKQVQGWSRKKKEALINGDFENLSHLSMAYRDRDSEALPEDLIDGDFENLSHLSTANRDRDSEALPEDLIDGDFENLSHLST
ncbi:MAG: GIY-YIG nuclease family protein, partial [Flavobacteriaceae bacterium]|nr:GIY-YIG nuclease family protein [Flavobacteriaceae bacterium]